MDDEHDSSLNAYNGDNNITHKHMLSLLYYSISGNNWIRKNE